MFLHVENSLKVISVTLTLFLLLSSHGKSLIATPKSRLLLNTEHWFFATGYCSTDDPFFVVHPTNQTAPFGESVNFECTVSNCDNHLTFLVNGRSLEYLNVSEDYYRKSVICDQQGQHVAMLSIIVNDKTLRKVKYVNCNLTLSNEDFRVISSQRAYIDKNNIAYPCQLQSECLNNITVNTECSINTNLPSNTAHKGKLTMTLLLISLLSQLL
jgi:hypothetical protein